MSKADATHFDSYRDQTKIKHRILTGYLPAYFTALSGRAQAMLYADGFAGCGFYSDGTNRDPGSPILALELLAADPARAKQVRTIFIENRDDHFEDLGQAVGSFCKNNPLVHAPILRKGRFADVIDDAIASLGAPVGPTFLFVDPCGVGGITLSVVSRIVGRGASELFMFFNSSGIERIIGAARQTGTSATLEELFGGRDRVARLLADVRDLRGEELERRVLENYCVTLRAATGCRYLLPFRVEAESREDTSHYLIHACKDCLGFKIMKHVMTEVVPNGDPRSGLLQFKQASAGDGTFEIRFDLAELRQESLTALGSVAVHAKTFIDARLCRPTDFYSEKAHKAAIVDLEREGKVGVYKDKNCQLAYPAEKRTRMNSKSGQREVTLGESCWLRRVV